MSKNIDIFNILSGGERVTLECKKATKGVPVSLWDTYSAFANTYGGIVWWNNSVGRGRAHGRNGQFQAF